MADDHDRTCKKSSNTTRSGVNKLFETFAFAACFSNIGTFMNLPPLLTSAFLVQRDLVFHSGLPQLGLFPVVNFNSAMRFEASYLEICASPSCVVRITCYVRKVTFMWVRILNATFLSASRRQPQDLQPAPMPALIYLPFPPTCVQMPGPKKRSQATIFLGVDVFSTDLDPSSPQGLRPTSTKDF